jgi:hypothetical protein
VKVIIFLESCRKIIVSSLRYLNKAECIIKQYSDYTFPELDDLPVNGINTQVRIFSTMKTHNLFPLLDRERILLIMEVLRRLTEPTVS